MRVFVTGGTGFVGSHVLSALVGAGHEVVALERTSSRRPEAPPAVRWVLGDVLARESLERGMAGAEAVVHAAAVLSYSPGDAGRQARVNVEGTRNVLEAAVRSGVRRVVHTSSVAAIGRGLPGRIADEDTRYDWPPGLRYNETKRASELLVRAERRVETVCLSPAQVFGPEDPTARLLPLFRGVKRRLFLVSPPGGTTVCDVRDVARAHVAALDRGDPGARYILGGPHVTWAELLGAIGQVLGVSAARLTVPPMALRVGAVPLRAAARLAGGVGLEALLGRERGSLADAGLLPLLDYFQTRCWYSSERAVAALGYQARDLPQTVADTAASYQRSGHL